MTGSLEEKARDLAKLIESIAGAQLYAAEDEHISTVIATALRAALKGE